MSTPQVPAGGYYPQEPYYAPGWSAPAGPPPPRRSRPGLTVTLVVLGALLVVALLVGVVLGIRYQLGVRPLGDVDAARSATPRQLETGHCLEELPPDGAVGQVRVVPCDQPHEAEVVGTLPLDDPTWPGDEAVTRSALAYCRMDNAEEAAGFRAVAWAPTQRGWSQGDRRALCLAWLEDGTATGSFVADDQVTTR
jgi:hypothetical protein